MLESFFKTRFRKTLFGMGLAYRQFVFIFIPKLTNIMNKKVLLMILDGWGITQNPDVSAIAKANTPFMDNIL